MATIKNLKSTAQHLKMKGDKLYSKKKFKAALKSYLEAVVFSKTAIYYGNQEATPLVANQEDAEDLEGPDQTQQMDPTRTKDSLEHVICLLVFGEVDESIRICEGILRESPSEAAQLELEKALKAKKLVGEAEANYSDKEYSLAVKKLDQCLKICSKSLKLKTMKAECLALLEKYKDAKKIVTQVLQQDNSFVEAIYVKGLCFYYANSMTRALNIFLDALGIDLYHAKAIDLYAKTEKFISKMKSLQAAIQEGDHIEQFDISQHALWIDPSNKAANIKFHYHLASAARKMGQFGIAIDNSSRAIDLDNRYADPYYIRGECYVKLKQYQNAVENYETLYGFEKSQKAFDLLQEAKSLNQAKKSTIIDRPSRTTTYYTMLGISRGATGSEIRTGYRRTARLHHPDKHPDASEETKKSEEQKFKEVKKAYDVLSDPVKRSSYDKELDRMDLNCN